MRRFLIVVLVLLAVLVAGDRVAAVLASHEAERRLTNEGFTAPAVDVHGFPFVTQLLSRDFGRVSLTSDSLVVGKGRANRVTADLDDVRAPQGQRVQIAGLTASGTVPYAEVIKAVGASTLRLTPAGGGQVTVSRTVQVLGTDLDVTARARVEAEGNRILLVPTAVQLAGGGSLSDEATRLVRDKVALAYRIPGLPQGLQVRSVTAEAGGFRVSVTGRDLAVDGF